MDYTTSYLPIIIVVVAFVALIIYYRKDSYTPCNDTQMKEPVEVLYFKMPSCPHCIMFDPVWERVATQGKQRRFVPIVIDVTQPGGREKMNQMGVIGTPTLVIQRPCGRTFRFTGNRDDETIFNWISKTQMSS
jgi:thiol-disulfide isomerase/thioredoxin